MKYSEDIAAGVGLLLVGWGAWQHSPAAAALTVGGLLLLLGVAGGIAKAVRG